MEVEQAVLTNTVKIAVKLAVDLIIKAAAILVQVVDLTAVLETKDNNLLCKTVLTWVVSHNQECTVVWTVGKTNTDK